MLAQAVPVTGRPHGCSSMVVSLLATTMPCRRYRTFHTTDGGNTTHPEDTIWFYTLRMRDAGFFKSTPQKLIAEHTDWRFLNELKHELKA
jgi:hypothetical protein